MKKKKNPQGDKKLRLIREIVKTQLTGVTGAAPCIMPTTNFRRAVNGG